jgi:hypothetical protein
MCAGMVFLAQAQNARIDALGGAMIVPDFSRTLYNPAVMNDYRNNAEINFGSGAIMATKSAGSVFSLGAVMNRGLMLRYFYAAAGAQLYYPPYTNTTLVTTPGASNMQYFPHILWGIDLTTVQIGFDTYLEWDRVTYDSLSEIPGAFQEVNEDLTISHPGLIAGFKINLKSASILFHMGGGLPRATGTIERSNVAPIGTAKIETESGVFGQGGFEVTVNLIKTDITFGADGRYEKFQFSRLPPGTGAVKVRSNKTNDKTVTPYLGAKTRMANGLLIVGMGRSVIDILTSGIDAGTDSTTDYYLYHSLIGGFEKQFQKPWKFDSLALRGGVTWGATTNWTTHDATPSILTTTTSKPLSRLGSMSPYIGFGVSKTFFRMDLLLNPASWNSAFVGPEVSRVTVSLTY